MFDPLEEESLLQKIQGFFSDRQFFDKVMRLCQERKEIFEFDWKERMFQMVKNGFSHDGKRLQRNNP
jgi:hypothetical protein